MQRVHFRHKRVGEIVETLDRVRMVGVQYREKSADGAARFGEEAWASNNSYSVRATDYLHFQL